VDEKGQKPGNAGVFLLCPPGPFPASDIVKCIQGDVHIIDDLEVIHANTNKIGSLVK
jgi:hypothetical protein